MPLSEEAVRLLQWVARGHEQGQEWVRWDGDPPCDSWKPLTWLLLVEHDGSAFRLTDFGWDALGNLIEVAE
jgi:hypothetical protein